MKILIVGDGNHQFIASFVKWLKVSTNSEIDILSFTPPKDSSNSIFNNHFSIQTNGKFSKIINKIAPLRRIVRHRTYKKIIDGFSLYEVVHFHYVSDDTLFLIKALRNKVVSKIILSIWGSDLYKLSKSKEKRFKAACETASYITFSNYQSIEYFLEKFQWEKKNLKLCRFGLSPLEALIKLQLANLECKSFLGLDPRKLTITVGYNLSPAQQHLRILEMFFDPAILRFADQIYLMLPLTYGGTPEYKNKIIEKLKKLPFEYVCFEEFLTDAKVAEVRKASDIMIQLQETDQFSGSMQEHLFAENVVITGSWLPYQTLKDQGVWFCEISDFSELPILLSQIIEDFPRYKAKTVTNQESIGKLSLWENSIRDWVDLYVS
jgi:glycosyltransferase involved in cell wall biosynthesis